MLAIIYRLFEGFMTWHSSSNYRSASQLL